MLGIKTLALSITVAILWKSYSKDAKELCPETPPHLKGKIDVALRTPPLEWPALEAKYKPINALGGLNSPKECQARHKVAIIIPCTNRDSHLRKLLDHLHPLLQKQQLDYGIYVVEQLGSFEFNRGLSLNIGYAFVEDLHLNYHCYIFHDVDLLPDNDQNLYTCPTQPRHLSARNSLYKKGSLYEDYFGGCFAISTDHFALINGFSNRFWGWGGEDDDIRKRLLNKHLEITRYPLDIASYTAIPHKRPTENPDRLKIQIENFKLFDVDGLNSLKGLYDIQTVKPTYTHTLISFIVNKQQD